MVINAAGSRRERKKASLRAEIIARAVELFAARGIEGVSIDQIAEAADIGKGTVYNYFKTKEDIVVAFMVDVEARVQARLGKFVSSKRRLDAILTDFILLQFRLKRRHYRFIRVFLGQMFFRTEQFLPYMIEIQKVTDPPLETLFRNLQLRGSIRKDMNLEDLLLVFKTIQLGLTALWVIEGPPFRHTERTVQQEMRLFCEGLRGTTV